MRSIFGKCTTALLIALVFILMFAVVADAASQYLPGLRLGTGNLVITNGTFTVRDSNSITKFSIAPATGNTAISGTLAVTGAATIPIIPIVAETTAARTVTSADFGKMIVCSYASGATTITLPAPAAGLVGGTFLVAQTENQNLTITGATADNNAIVADGVATTDNVAFSTSSHKIGAMARVTCISATKWLITNASSCTMTVEAAD